MKINQNVLNLVTKKGAKIVAVTKYFDKKTTHKILETLKPEACVWALGENRVTALIEKKLPRERTHFIGNIQSKDIKKIVEHCSVIHSLYSLKHANLINKACEESKRTIKAFCQVNISGEPQKGGLPISELEKFIQACDDFESLEIIGISGMGAGEFISKEKEAEFELLKSLRDEFMPGGIISAGTSRDYAIALEEGLEVVRVGKALFPFSLK